MDAEDLRGLLAVVSARALGQRVSIVAHEVLISPQTAASLLGVSRPMLYRYIERGDLSAVRVGTHWRMRAGDVVALARRRAGQADAIDTAIAAALEPVVFGTGRPFFGAMGSGDIVTLANPSRVV